MKNRFFPTGLFVGPGGLISNRLAWRFESFLASVKINIYYNIFQSSGNPGRRVKPESSKKFDLIEILNLQFGMRVEKNKLTNIEQ